MRRYSININEAAKLLNRDPQTLYIAIRQKRLNAVKRDGRWFVSKGEIQRVIGKSQIRKNKAVRNTAGG